MISYCQSTLRRLANHFDCLWSVPGPWGLILFLIRQAPSFVVEVSDYPIPYIGGVGSGPSLVTVVECRDGFYCIEISRIWEDEFNSQLYGWVEHMACTKDWVDIADFVEALRLARSLAWVQHQNQSLTRPFFPLKNLPVCPVEITRRGERA